MPVDFDLPENGLEFAVRVDDESAALDAPVLFSVHILFFIDAVGLRDGGIFIAEQGKRQAKFFHEFLVRLLAVETDSEDDAPRPA